MKTKYCLVKNEVDFLSEMGFDEDDIRKITALQNEHPGQNMILSVLNGGSTISVSPSHDDFYLYVINNDASQEIIDGTLSDIQKYIDNGSIIEA